MLQERALNHAPLNKHLVAPAQSQAAAQRARREALLERDVATAQVKAQAAALAAEREALAGQRLRAEELAGLAEQVGVGGGDAWG
jgi:hypothetical protein